MKNKRGIEELLSDMLIRQDRLIEALKTNTMILKELADGQKNVVDVQRGLLTENQESVTGQKALHQNQQRLESKFVELLTFLKENIKSIK